MAIGSDAEALRLAEASDWKGLQRLVERHPEVARARGEYGMLPIHWACTERRVPLALLNRLLAAHPAGARARNAAELLPLHIAIRAGAHAAWLFRLVKAFPGAVQARIPSGETAVELAEGMRLDAERLKVLYRAERELSPEHDSAGSEQEELEGEDDVVVRGSEEDDEGNDEQLGRNKRPSSRKSVNSSRGSHSKKTRKNQDEQHEEQEQTTWPAPFVGNGGGTTRLSAATELSDVELVEEASALSSSSSLSEGAVRLSASRDHLVSPSSVSTSSNQFSPPNSVSAPVPLSSAFTDAALTSSGSAYARRHKHGRGYAARDVDGDEGGAFPASSRRRFDGFRDRNNTQSLALQRPSGSGVSSDDKDLRSMISTSMGGRHQSLPIIPSFETGRRNSIGAFVESADRGYASGSDDSDVNAPGQGPHPHYFHSQPNRPSQQQQLYEQQEPLNGQYHQQQRRTYQTQPHPGKQRHHSPFAYRRASHGEVTLASSTGAHRRGGTFESPPEWRLDDECAICRVTFNMFKHRHHCRNCGKSICRQHSADKKIAMESKGFTTPQRVCITCFAMIAQSRSLKHDLALDDLAGEPLLNPVAFQQQHYATPGSSAGSTATALRSTAMSSAGTGARKSSLRGSVVAGSSPGSNAVNAAATVAMTAAGSAPMATAYTSTTTPAMMTAAASAPMDAATSRELALAGQVHELRALVGAQQRQLEQLAQSNAQMQHQLLEQEEEKAETTLLITQLMTRVSALELSRGREEDEDEEDEDEDEDEDDRRRAGGSGSGSR